MWPRGWLWTGVARGGVVEGKEEKRAVQKWEEEKFNKGRERQMGREHGLGRKSQRACSVRPSGTRQTRVPGRAAPASAQKGLLPRPHPDHRGHLYLQPTRPACTLHPRFCTLLARRDEGYLQRLEACKLGHSSIVHPQKSARQILFSRVGVRMPQTGGTLEVHGRPLPTSQPFGFGGLWPQRGRTRSISLVEYPAPSSR